jgi:hypothetical protein
MPKIIIQPAMSDGSQQPVRLTINGVETELPVGQEITVTDEQFLALGHTDHNIEITVEGEAAADEIEQAPAPASTGGDAGGGGDSGDAATDTSARRYERARRRGDDDARDGRAGSRHFR